MTFGSLFAGIGGFDLGLERAGMECKWQVEIDAYCRKVLSLRFPDAKQYTDIRAVKWGDVARVDVICGGFPCQPVSYAGKRLAQSDERWLWDNFRNCVSAIRPEVVIVENVAGLLTAGMGDVLGGLSEIGYDAEWDTIPAYSFGAYHRRERVWIVAYPERGRIAKRMGVGGIFGSRPNAKEIRGFDRFHLILGDSEVAPSKWRPEGCTADPRPLLIRKDDGVPNGVDRLKCCGNAVVPPIAEWIGRRIMEFAQ